jgi:hypothetical protein
MTGWIIGILLIVCVCLFLVAVGQRCHIVDLQLRFREALLKAETERVELANSLRLKGIECDQLKRANKKLGEKK